MTRASYTPAVKSLGKFPDPFIAEISGQPDALRRAAAGLGTRTEELAVLRDRTGGSLVFAGMGSSYDACYPAVTTLGTAGVTAFMVDASELLHFRLPMLGVRDQVVFVSQSGESAETVRAAVALRDRPDPPRIVAVTNEPGSSLARAADIVLPTNAGAESGPSTMTFAAALVVIAAIAKAAIGVAPTEVIDRLALEADIAATAIDDLLGREHLPDDLVTWHGGRATTVILARGGARAAAEMGALTLKEGVGMPVESLQAAQFRHGPLEIAGPGLAAMIVATEPETRELDLAMADELRRLGAAVWTITAGTPTPGATDIGPIDRLLSPAAAIVPAQLLAWRLAVLAGREPGSYRHAAKVTLHE
jgi:glucosamine--fructose-6-phosphate aminotransferase (isomerizing)